MKPLKLVLVTGVLVAFAAACTHVPEEEHAKDRQRLEGDDGGSTDTDAATEAATEPDAALVCAHPICAAGGPLDATCDTCATQLCAVDPYCCNTAWDATCVGEVASICGNTCTAPPPTDGGAETCTHPICAAGGPLVAGCNACTAQLCAQDPFCCAVSWDATCVGEVTGICGISCN